MRVTEHAKEEMIENRHALSLFRKAKYLTNCFVNKYIHVNYQRKVVATGRSVSHTSGK